MAHGSDADSDTDSDSGSGSGRERAPQLRVTSVTIGAPDPRALARFYARLLGWTVTAAEPPRPGGPPEDGWAQLRPPAGQDGPTLNFEYERAWTRPQWPAAAGRPHATQHLDILAADLDASVAWGGRAGRDAGGVPAAGRRARPAGPGRAPVLPVRRVARGASGER